VRDAADAAVVHPITATLSTFARGPLRSWIVYGYNGDDPAGGQVLQPSLTDAVRAFTSGSIGPEDFHAVFTTCKVYCPRGERPGFLALHDTPQPVIPMFSSLVELRRYSGEQSRFFTVTGAEVLDLLPTGYGIVLDIEGEHRVVFDAQAIEQMIDYTMKRMYG
jgi:hypothetical protein